MSSESNVFHVETPAQRTELLRRKFKGKLSPLMCPRCNTKSIDRQMRHCRNCKGVVLFANIDDGKFCEETLDYPYIWWKSTLSGIEGWFPLDFFKTDNNLGEIR